MAKDEERRARTKSDEGRTWGRSRWWRYGPLLIWAALIFIGSGSLLSGSHTGSFLLGPLRWLFPHAGDQTLWLIHLLIRKAGHLTEYAILAWLAARAFRSSRHEFLRRQWFWWSLILVAAYALSDEFHQSFVPSRGASIWDSAIDTMGGLIALSLICLWQLRKPKRKRFRRASVAAAGDGLVP